MSKFRIMLGALALLLGTLVSPMFPTSPANAVSGCHTNVIDKADHWRMRRSFFDYDGAMDSPYVTLRLSASLVYTYCPNWPMVYPKIQPKRFVWCWSFVGGRPSGMDVFGGVKFNGYVFNKWANTNPPEVMVDDNGHDMHCRAQELGTPWLSMGGKPRWAVTSWITMHFEHDIEVIFRTDKGSHVKRIRPDHDENVSGWYY